MFDKYKLAGLGALLSSSTLVGTLYYFLSYPQGEILPEVEIQEEQGDLIIEPTEETKEVVTPDQEKPSVTPEIPEAKENNITSRKVVAPSLPSNKPVKETTSDVGLFVNIKSDSIMYEFKAYLIGNKNSNTPWKPKLEIWKEKIEKKENINPFSWTTKDQPKFKNIKDRCETAYKRESWNIGGSLKKQEVIQKYWGLVWTMCAQEGKTAPSNWGGAGK